VDEAVVAIVCTTVLLTAVEVAYRLGRRSRAPHDEARRRHIAAIRGVMLGLLSLLLGFTFSMAVERYSVRRDLVVKEYGEAPRLSRSSGNTRRRQRNIDSVWTSRSSMVKARRLATLRDPATALRDQRPRSATWCAAA
jgi:hypothetical protein